MAWMKYAWVVVLLLVMGCASAPPANDEAIALARALKPEAGKAVIYVVRAGTIGAMQLASVTVNGLAIGGVPVRAFLRTEVAPGPTHIALGAIGHLRTATVETVAGEIYFIGVNYKFEPVLMDAKDGERWVRKLGMVESL